MTELTLEEFLDKLAAKSPTPGGGSVAALAGAAAAALISMAARISGERKIAEKSERFRRVLQKLIIQDTLAFKKVIKEKGSQAALKGAAEVPLQTARYAFEVIKLAEILSKSCNLKVASDIGVAVLMAAAAVEGALLNVKVNLDLIEDEEFKKEIRKPIEKELYLAGYLAGLIVQNLGQRYQKSPS